MKDEINEKTIVTPSFLISKNDFRVGNFFNGTYENEINNKIETVVCEILGYDPFSDYYWVENKEGIVDFRNFQKIHLTKKWLLKFGFTQEENGKFFKNDILSISIGECFYVFSNLGSGEARIKSNLKYVHELQNLYFGLTGHELTVV